MVRCGTGTLPQCDQAPRHDRALRGLGAGEGRREAVVGFLRHEQGWRAKKPSAPRRSSRPRNVSRAWQRSAAPPPPHRPPAARHHRIPPRTAARPRRSGSRVREQGAARLSHRRAVRVGIDPSSIPSSIPCSRAAAAVREHVDPPFVAPYATTLSAAMGSASTRSVTTVGLWFRRSISSRSSSAFWCASARSSIALDQCSKSSALRQRFQPSPRRKAISIALKSSSGTPTAAAMREFCRDRGALSSQNLAFTQIATEINRRY
mmetsp:Transcript_7511/g.16160  ORF Transcript_7511/g.16160 Transcript_7511/m.16160 type:complete len:262 (+) Transcript_7511:34-819(+)